MISLIMICSLVGTVMLILICGLLTAISPDISEPIVPSFPESAYTLDISDEVSEHKNEENTVLTESRLGDRDMIKDDFREDIIRHSVEILRSMDWSEEKIREEMLRDFSIEEKRLDAIMENGT